MVPCGLRVSVALVDGWGLLHAWAKGGVRGVPCLGSRGGGEGFMAVS